MVQIGTDYVIFQKPKNDAIYFIQYAFFLLNLFKEQFWPKNLNWAFWIKVIFKKLLAHKEKIPIKSYVNLNVPKSDQKGQKMAVILDISYDSEKTAWNFNMKLSGVFVMVICSNIIL